MPWAQPRCVTVDAPRGASTVTQRPARFETDVVTDFWRDGYCICRGLLSDATLVPIRELITEYIDARASALLHGGHIFDTCQTASFETRWSRLRQQVADPGRDGPIGTTSNWGVPSPHGRVLLDQRVHQLYCRPEVSKIAEKILQTHEIYGCGNYWIRPMTCNDMMGKYPLHQDSHFYGGECSEPSRCDILTVWMPLVPCDAKTGALQLVRGSHTHGKISLDYKARPEGGLQEPLADYSHYGELHVEPMMPGDVMFFHNLVLHGTSNHHKQDYVRWAIDLRYERAPDPSRYSQQQEYYNTFPSFRVGRNGSGTSWPQWRQQWRPAGSFNKPKI